MTADVKKEFGLALKAWRKKSQLSQEELAWRAGLHRTYVADIERGARNPSLQSIQKLAAALELSLSTLFKPFNQADAEAGLSTAEAVDILLVEDNSQDVELTLEAFRRAHLTNRIHVCRDGTEALDYLWGPEPRSDAPLQHRPRLILLDLKLPKMKGLDVLRAVRRNAATRNIPVVVLTGSQDGADVEESRKLGANDYLIKPVDFQNFSRITPRLSLRWVLMAPGPE